MKKYVFYAASLIMLISCCDDNLSEIEQKIKTDYPTLEEFKKSQCSLGELDK